MSICVLNCAAMAPWFPRWHVGTPCLLIETNQGLVLVDTGLGLHDYTSPSPVVRLFRSALRVPNDPGLTAVRQLIRLGYQPEAVQHIILTHLHFDHAGGLPDFPHAQVHIHQREYDALRQPRSWMEMAYDRSHFAHGPHWVLYERPTDKWQGFDALRLPFTPEMYLIPLFGHTRGHCGVAIQDENGWLFQCGDALPTNAQFDLTPDWLNQLAIGPHVPRLRAWAAAHPDVRIMAAHMWLSFFETRRATQPVVSAARG